MANGIIIYGTGGLGRGLVDLIRAINKVNSNEWDLIGFVDDQETRSEINGIRVLGGIDYLSNIDQNINVVLAFGSPDVKRSIFTKLSTNPKIKFPNLIHPSVELSNSNKIGTGNVISKGAAMSANITIGNFNLIHYNCSIGHDVNIGDYNSIFPLTALSGYVSLGDCAEIGTNTAVIPNVKVGSNAIIGAGSTIIEDVRENSKVVGVPGREI